MQTNTHTHTHTHTSTHVLTRTHTYIHTHAHHTHALTQVPNPPQRWDSKKCHSEVALSQYDLMATNKAESGYPTIVGTQVLRHGRLPTKRAVYSDKRALYSRKIAVYSLSYSYQKGRTWVSDNSGRSSAATRQVDEQLLKPYTLVKEYKGIRSIL